MEKVNHGPLTGMSIPFAVLLTYCWVLQFIGTVPAIGIPEEWLYRMFVGPSALFALMGVVLMLVGRRAFGRDIWILVAFLAVVTMVSLYRTDMATILTIGLMCISLAVILHFQIRISPTHVNILFLMSIPIAAGFHAIGLSDFPVLPSFSSLGTLSWRVSTLPLISSGGFFALMVLFINIFYTSGRFRLICLVGGGYFLLFSGMRTAIFAALLVGAYLMARRSGFLQRSGWRFAFFSAAVGFFTLSIFSSDQLASLPILSNDFIRSLIVREDNLYGLDLGGQVFSAAIRSWMIGEHIALGLSSPLVGIGTFEFQMMHSGYGQFDNLTTGSEAYLTGLFARIGLLMLPLLYVIYRLRDIPPLERDFTRCMKLILFLAMITYGSFVVPYDFIFLLITVGILNGYAGRPWSKEKERVDRYGRMHAPH